MGGVDVCPWSRAVRAKDMGKGSVWGLSPGTYAASASCVGCGKVAQGVDGVE